MRIYRVIILIVLFLFCLQWSKGYSQTFSGHFDTITVVGTMYNISPDYGSPQRLAYDLRFIPAGSKMVPVLEFRGDTEVIASNLVDSTFYDMMPFRGTWLPLFGSKYQYDAPRFYRHWRFEYEGKMAKICNHYIAIFKVEATFVVAVLPGKKMRTNFPHMKDYPYETVRYCAVLEVKILE